MRWLVPTTLLAVLSTTTTTVSANNVSRSRRANPSLPACEQCCEGISASCKTAFKGGPGTCCGNTHTGSFCCPAHGNHAHGAAKCEKCDSEYVCSTSKHFVCPQGTAKGGVKGGVGLHHGHHGALTEIVEGNNHAVHIFLFCVMVAAVSLACVMMCKQSSFASRLDGGVHYSAVSNPSSSPTGPSSPTGGQAAVSSLTAAASSNKQAGAGFLHSLPSLFRRHGEQRDGGNKDKGIGGQDLVANAI